MRSVQLTGYGEPLDVVKMVNVPDIDAPGQDEILLKVEAAPVEPSDLYMIAGIYGNLPPLPHVLGIQGVGRVVAIGSSVKHLKEGDLTLIPPFTPTWIERVKTKADWLRPLPSGNVNQLSMLGINPATAYLLLTEFVKLARGDSIIQNAANSSVGRAVIAIAKSRGIKTVNIVRRADIVDEISALGGDVVLVDGPDLADRVSAATGKADISLALDGVGENATQNLLNSITRYGTVLVWSGMSGKPFLASGPRLLFFDQTIRGFWIFNYFRKPESAKLVAMYDELASLVISGDLRFPVSGEFALEKNLDAIAVAGRYNGKAILKP